MLTARQIVSVLNGYAPDMVDVLHGMASLRGIDPASLTPTDYRRLLEEEAEFSTEVDSSDLTKRYAADLRAIAGRIGV